MNQTLPPGGSAGRAHLGLVAAFTVFLAVLLYLLASSLTRRGAPSFDPSAVGVPLGDPGSGLTLTVEARDERAWRYVDLDAATIRPPGDSTGWDLAIQRFRIRTARPLQPSVAESGGPPAAAAPAPADWGLGKWYRYGMLSHLLEPLNRSYVIPTDRRAEARLEILSYYCTGLDAGCLTLRYLVAPGPGPPAP